MTILTEGGGSGVILVDYEQPVALIAVEVTVVAHPDTSIRLVLWWIPHSGAQPQSHSAQRESGTDSHIRNPFGPDRLLGPDGSMLWTSTLPSGIAGRNLAQVFRNESVVSYAIMMTCHCFAQLSGGSPAAVIKARGTSARASQPSSCCPPRIRSLMDRAQVEDEHFDGTWFASPMKEENRGIDANATRPSGKELSPDMRNAAPEGGVPERSNFGHPEGVADPLACRRP